MKCKNCGKEITERKPFCTECGAPLVWEDEMKPTEIMNEAPVQQSYTAAAAPAYQAPAAPAYTAPAPQQTYAPPAYQAPTAPAYKAPSAPVYAAPQPVREKKKGNGGKIALIIVTVVLALALIAAGVVAFLLYRENQELADTVSSLETENATLNQEVKKQSDDYDSLMEEYDLLLDDYNDIWDEYSFYNWNAVVCSEDNQYYHTYDCTDWNRDSFWIFNSEYAKYKEYTPCPNCQPQGDMDEP